MIHLTHPNAVNYISQDEFANFQSLMQQNGIDTNIEATESNENLIINAQQETKSGTIAIDESNLDNVPLRLTCISGSTREDSGMSISKSTNGSVNTCTVNNLREYYKSRLVINSDARNCLYFHLLSKWNWSWINDECKLSLYHFIMSQKLNMIACSIVLLSIFTGAVVLAIFGQIGAFFVILSAGFVVGDIMCMCMLMTGDIMMFELTIYTFDFWFINWNLINILIARIQLGIFNDQPMWYVIIRTISLCVVMISASTIDATCIPNRLKMNMIIVAVVYLCFVEIYFYFTGNDCIWNPLRQLDMDDTKISFKSVYLSSLSNLIIFTMKPIFKQLTKRFCSCRFDCRRGCVKINNINQDSSYSVMNRDKYYQRCETLYRRPFVQYTRIKQIENSGYTLMVE